MAIINSASPEIIWGLGGPEEDHQLHHCCWTGRVSEREEEEEEEDFSRTLLHVYTRWGLHWRKCAVLHVPNNPYCTLTGMLHVL